MGYRVGFYKYYNKISQSFVFKIDLSTHSATPPYFFTHKPSLLVRFSDSNVPISFDAVAWDKDKL